MSQKSPLRFYIYLVNFSNFAKISENLDYNFEYYFDFSKIISATSAKLFHSFCKTLPRHSIRSITLSNVSVTEEFNSKNAC